MNKKDIRPLQEAQMELLIETDRICSQLNLTYYLIGGTLLGAVRHKGFIPWDIDTDIAMPRADYEKFREYWKNNSSERFFYQHYTTEKNHNANHAVLKIRGTEIIFKNHNKNKYPIQCNGIYMDIFPLDYAPEQKKLQKRQQNKIKIMTGLLQSKFGYDYGSGKLKYIIKNILGVLLLPIPISFFLKKIDSCMKTYNGSSDKYLVSMASHYSYTKQLMPSEIYGTPQKIEFEGLMLNAPQKIDEYLKRIYGDYMKLPPEDERYGLIELVLKVNYGDIKNGVNND